MSGMPKPFTEGWPTYVDNELGFMLLMDSTKHTPTQIAATFKVMAYIAETHKFSADRPEDGTTQPPVVRS